MITGFNTDVKHETKMFHVQTEDRGLANPVVESLVYVGGEILLSKRSPYKDLITGDRVDEKALREMMDLQHRRVIEAVRRGRLDKGKIGEAPADWADDTLPHPEKVSPAALAAVSAILSAPPEPFPGDPPARPGARDDECGHAGRRDAFAPRPGDSSRRAAAGGVVTPAAPVTAGPSKPKSGAGLRSLDQVIVDYLASEAASEHLEIAVTTDGELLSGETVTITVKASTSLTEKPLAGAHVSIRVVSTVRPPQILFSRRHGRRRRRGVRLRPARHRHRERGAHHRRLLRPSGTTRSSSSSRRSPDRAA